MYFAKRKFNKQLIKKSFYTTSLNTIENIDFKAILDDPNECAEMKIFNLVDSITVYNIKSFLNANLFLVRMRPDSPFRLACLIHVR